MELIDLLIESGEGFYLDNEFILSDRVVSWLYEAYCKEITPEKASMELHSLSDADELLPWFTKRLNLPAIKTLKQLLKSKIDKKAAA